MNPVCIIGIDGGTLKFIEPLAKKGELPFFKKLMEQGEYSTLITTIPPLTPSAWSSFMTGKNPGKHGVLDFYELDNTLSYRISSFKLKKQKKLWNYLSEKNLKSIIFFVPFTYPPEKINGILISGFLTPNINSNFTYPPEFKEELLKKFPDYQISENIKFSKKNPEKFLEEILRITDKHSKVMQYLIKEKEWDFFMGVFMGIDHAQHWLWYKKEYIEKVYKKIDEELENIYELLPEGTLFIIISDHGFQKLKGHFYVNAFLKNRKLLYLKREFKNIYKEIMYKTGLSPLNLSKIVFKLGLEKYLRKDKESFGKTAQKIGFSYRDIDFEKTKAFGFGYYGFIYICDKKFDFGKVSIRERESIIEKLREYFKELGEEKNLNIKIWRKEEIYNGPFLEKFPDIVYSIDDFAYPGSWVFMPDINIFGPSLTEKSGEHDLKGIFFINQKKRKLNKLKKQKVRIFDITPTVLKFLKIDVEDLDGESVI
jgi:predicted AlkP superfamily phosphohydrolase/phosphomutase